MDTCLIAADQRAEHYEMAAYGTLVAWAQAMGHAEAAKPARGALTAWRRSHRRGKSWRSDSMA